jgi:hypothetical protein
MGKRLGIIGAVLALAAVAIFGWNYLSLQVPLNAALSVDQRNDGIAVRAHYASYVQPNTVVFDLRSAGPEKAPIDVFRAFLQFAHELKDRRFERVVLSHRGEYKLQIEGEYFQKLGVEYKGQNPVYTVRTFPEHLYRMDGKTAYGQWTGGLLGVLKGQMEDFNKFHREWYIDDLTAASK